MLCVVQLWIWELLESWCDISVFIITYLASPAVLMKANSRVVVQVLLLALVAQVTLCQHWSYGWLPGGKRSVGELEATIRVSDYFMRSFSYRKCAHFIELKVHFSRKSLMDLFYDTWLRTLELKKCIQIVFCFFVPPYCLLLLLDDGHRRSGVLSRRGECPNPRET